MVGPPWPTILFFHPTHGKPGSAENIRDSPTNQRLLIEITTGRDLHGKKNNYLPDKFVGFPTSLFLPGISDISDLAGHPTQTDSQGTCDLGFNPAYTIEGFPESVSLDRLQIAAQGRGTRASPAHVPHVGEISTHIGGTAPKLTMSISAMITSRSMQFSSSLTFPGQW